MHRRILGKNILIVFVIYAMQLCGPLNFAHAGSPERDMKRPPLMVHAFNRPPYYSFHGPSRGFLLEATKEILEAADIPFAFVETPPKRILADFKGREEYACSPGWYKTQEREEFALFSDPISVNLPLGAAIRKKTAQSLPAHPSLDALLESGLTLGLKDGFSYGDWVDARLKTRKPRSYAATAENEQLLRMIARGRIDYLFINPEEFTWLMSQCPDLSDKLIFLPLADAPCGEARRLMCDKAVPAEIMSRINQAIARMLESKRYQALITAYGLVPAD